MCVTCCLSFSCHVSTIKHKLCYGACRLGRWLASAVCGDLSDPNQSIPWTDHFSCTPSANLVQKLTMNPSPFLNALDVSVVTLVKQTTIAKHSCIAALKWKSVHASFPIQPSCAPQFLRRGVSFGNLILSILCCRTGSDITSTCVQRGHEEKEAVHK